MAGEVAVVRALGEDRIKETPTTTRATTQRVEKLLGNHGLVWPASDL